MQASPTNLTATTHPTISTSIGIAILVRRTSSAKSAGPNASDAPECCYSTIIQTKLASD